MKINKKTLLRKGLELSPNVNLDALTSGEHRRRYARRLWGTLSNPLPERKDTQNVVDNLPEEQRIENWNIASNLQELSEEVIEPLITEYGSNLKIFRGYQNPGNIFISRRKREKGYNKHFTGEAVDIFLEDFRSNMYHHASDMYEIVKDHVVEVGLIYSSTSWIHFGINAEFGPNEGQVGNPRIFTIDLTKQIYTTGFVPLRGIAV